MRLSLITAPSVEPVSVEEQKAHSRIQVNTEDDLITALIKSARNYAEGFTGRAFIDQVWELSLDDFPADGESILIPLLPLDSITSVKYTDVNGVEQDFTDYILDNASQDRPARIKNDPDASYPDVKEGVYNTVRIRFKAGYGEAAADVPEDLKTAIKMIAAELYERRETAIPGAVGLQPVVLNADLILWQYRYVRL